MVKTVSKLSSKPTPVRISEKRKLETSSVREYCFKINYACVALLVAFYNTKFIMKFCRVEKKSRRV